jgi:bifunctional NMN adenylyltransferase/nudix hydrolase
MKYGVFIGRFQPVTYAHRSIIQRSLEKYDRLIIIVGSARATQSLRNPFNAFLRKMMLTSIIPEEQMHKVSFFSLSDSNYNFNQWIKDVQSIVNSVTERDDEISLIGAFKDAGSYWLNAFPQWKIDNMQLDKTPSGTEVRKMFFEKDFSGVMEAVDYHVWEIMVQWKNDEPALFEDMCKEHEFIKDYRKQWEAAPYPPIFVTTDSIVLCKGHILIIKRLRNPGKNLFALPGGFLNPGEYIKDCAIRELKEETKIDVARPILENSLKKVKVFDDPLRDERGRTITHAHVFELNLKDLPEVKADDDAKEVMWLAFDEIDKLDNQFYADHYQIIKNIL